jgi:hypothetical protein
MRYDGDVMENDEITGALAVLGALFWGGVFAFFGFADVGPVMNFLIGFVVGGIGVAAVANDGPSPT